MKKEMSKRKKILIISLVIIIIALAIIVFAKTMNNKEEGNINPASSAAGNSSYQVKYSPLSPEEINKVADTILSSEFIKSIPEKEPISLFFFKFENGERIWQDGFLIGKNQLLTEGTPGISLILHSKYISQLNGNNLCDIINQANKNGDLGFESKYSTAILLIKYVGMLKYRDCFGF
ncbi:MAG: hypothetical protein NTU63_03750 [Candidatus Pacearchaeota archaeon]|nr:hypothetical protein [Candidatus Pacearchaeota archaeon]